MGYECKNEENRCEYLISDKNRFVCAKSQNILQGEFAQVYCMHKYAHKQKQTELIDSRTSNRTPANNK